MTKPLNLALNNVVNVEFKKVMSVIGTAGATKYDLMKSIIANDVNTEFSESMIRTINPSYSAFLDDVCEELVKSRYITLESDRYTLTAQGINIFRMI